MQEDDDDSWRIVDCDDDADDNEGSWQKGVSMSRYHHLVERKGVADT